MNLNLKIDLSVIPNKINREKKYDAGRERLTCEKYFRQAITVYNKDQKLVKSGFIQINDYSNMCRMVRVCNPHKKNYHFCQKWEYDGPNMHPTDEHTIIDLSTGNKVGLVKSECLSGFIKNIEETIDDISCMVDDLERDQYSELLLECLTEYSDRNRPPQHHLFVKDDDESLKESCDCNLLELLEIVDQYNSGDINNDKKEELISALKCKCNHQLFKTELTEEEKVNREIMKEKARQEVEEVLELKND